MLEKYPEKKMKFSLATTKNTITVRILPESFKLDRCIKLDDGMLEMCFKYTDFGFFPERMGDNVAELFK